MARVYLIALGAGLVSALMFATYGANLFFALLLIPFSPAPLFLVGLASGVQPVMLAGGAASVLSGFFLGSFAFSLVYALTIMAPAALLVYLALLRRVSPDGKTEWYPTGPLLATLVAFMSILFVILAAAFSGQEGGMHGFLTDQILEYYESYDEEVEQSGAELPAPGEMVRQSSFNAVTGAPGMSVLFMSICLLISQAMLLRFGKSLRPSFDLIHLELPKWLSYGLVGSGALALFSSGQLRVLGTGLAITFAVPFFFLGLTVLHAFCRKIAAGLIVLIFVYGILLFQPWVGGALAGLGFLERWLKLRQRALGSSAGQE